jgi:small basic protein (TIGR04137 family)
MRRPLRAGSRTIDQDQEVAGPAVEKGAELRNVRAHFFPDEDRIMSQHRSLKGASTIAAKRNVLKRFERVELMKKRGQWKDGAKVIGLPKTKPDI